MMIKGYCVFWYKVTNFLQKTTLGGKENLSGFFVQFLPALHDLIIQCVVIPFGGIVNDIV
jgi:hypothetical protein